MTKNPIKGFTSIAILTALLLLAFADTGPAEHTAPIKYLMNEPVSMLDWGIYRHGKRLEHSRVLRVS